MSRRGYSAPEIAQTLDGTGDWVRRVIHDFHEIGPPISLAGRRIRPYPAAVLMRLSLTTTPAEPGVTA